MNLIRNNSLHPDFKKLTALFDEYLVIIDGDEKDFFAQYNHIFLENVVICYENEVAIGCGAFKKHTDHKVEIKRMFVHPDFRGKEVASKILSELETWAKELNFNVSILETSIKLENAIRLYKKFGYEITEKYGQYVGVESSVCMKKILK
jgi:putative acetyltransferase